MIYIIKDIKYRENIQYNIVIYFILKKEYKGSKKIKK